MEIVKVLRKITPDQKFYSLPNYFSEREREIERDLKEKRGREIKTEKDLTKREIDRIRRERPLTERERERGHNIHTYTHTMHNNNLS